MLDRWKISVNDEERDKSEPVYKVTQNVPYNIINNYHANKFVLFRSIAGAKKSLIQSRQILRDLPTEDVVVAELHMIFKTVTHKFTNSAIHLDISRPAALYFTKLKEKYGDIVTIYVGMFYFTIKLFIYIYTTSVHEIK